VQNIDRANPFATEMILQRNGNDVTGQYSFGLGNGRIRGSVSGETLKLTWEWDGRFGYGVLRATADGNSFSGTWGYGEATAGAGTWSGRRRN
jgi:hypothetical protein